jgi:hypothetical protein
MLCKVHPVEESCILYCPGPPAASQRPAGMPGGGPAPTPRTLRPADDSAARRRMAQRPGSRWHCPTPRSHQNPAARRRTQRACMTNDRSRDATPGRNAWRGPTSSPLERLLTPPGSRHGPGLAAAPHRDGYLAQSGSSTGPATVRTLLCPGRLGSLSRPSHIPRGADNGRSQCRATRTSSTCHIADFMHRRFHTPASIYPNMSKATISWRGL